MSMSRLLYVGFLLVLAVLFAGVVGCSGSDSAQPTKTVTQTEPSTPSGEESPPTQTPSSDRGTAEAPTTEGSEPVESPGSDPASTVESYFDAVNAQDYERAWELGGKNLAGSWGAYVDGFADTLDTSVSVLGSEGSTVSVRLEATQTDGSLKEFAGTYTVRDGQIVSADIREVSASQPEERGAAPPYENCDEARAAGVAPLFPGDPGYTDELDRDGDGQACEWDRRE